MTNETTTNETTTTLTREQLDAFQTTRSKLDEECQAARLTSREGIALMLDWLKTTLRDGVLLSLPDLGPNDYPVFKAVRLRGDKPEEELNLATFDDDYDVVYGKWTIVLNEAGILQLARTKHERNHYTNDELTIETKPFNLESAHAGDALALYELLVLYLPDELKKAETRIAQYQSQRHQTEALKQLFSR